jgi:ubiquinone/menaquinone biosynthesis C-methylase UbiE
MPLARILEPELMDTPDDAFDYDSMDHAEVNRRFVEDLLAAGLAEGDILDLGTGTARIPIELCRQVDDCRVMAADAAIHMLDLARLNIELAGLITRITLTHLDAKQLPFSDGMFGAVISNSIVHHIPEPLSVLREAVRVTAPGGLLFFRDLLRPTDDQTVLQLVDTYAAGANDHQRKLFDDSLRAALDLNEIQDLVRQLGFDASGVIATSDRHWTWVARKR